MCSSKHDWRWEPLHGCYGSVINCQREKSDHSTRQRTNWIEIAPVQTRSKVDGHIFYSWLWKYDDGGPKLCSGFTQAGYWQYSKLLSQFRNFYEARSQKDRTWLKGRLLWLLVNVTTLSFTFESGACVLWSLIIKS